LSLAKKGEISYRIRSISPSIEPAMHIPNEINLLALASHAEPLAGPAGSFGTVPAFEVISTRYMPPFRLTHHSSPSSGESCPLSFDIAAL
jgi:hypothetical protein